MKVEITSLDNGKVILEQEGDHMVLAITREGEPIQTARLSPQLALAVRDVLREFYYNVIGDL